MTHESVTEASGITVGITNFNGIVYLQDTLDAIANLAGPIVEVILVDNASTDGSAEWASTHACSPRIIMRDQNEGPAVARNQLIREARCDRIFLLDNDVAPAKDCAIQLDAALDNHPNAAIAMPAVILRADLQHVQFVGASAHYLGVMSLEQANVPINELPTEVTKTTSLLSAALLLDRTRLIDRQLFDEAFFLYLEDHEAGLRCVLEGRDLLVAPAARCFHGEGTLGLSVRQTGVFMPTRIRYTIRNRWRLILKLYQCSTLFRFIPAFFSFEIFQFLGAIINGWFKHWLWAIRSILSDLPSLMRGRREFQQRRCRVDIKVLESGSFPFNPGHTKAACHRSWQKMLNLVVRWNWFIAGPRK